MSQLVSNGWRILERRMRPSRRRAGRFAGDTDHRICDKGDVANARAKRPTPIALPWRIVADRPPGVILAMFAAKRRAIHWKLQLDSPESTQIHLAR
jgi:hypothetical protein